MDLDHLRELLQLVAESDVAEVEIEEDDLKIVVRKQTSPPAQQAVTPTLTYPVGPQGGYPAPPQNPAGPPAQPQTGAGQPAGTSQTGEQTGGEESEQATGTDVRAPIVGTFYRSPSPDDDPFVKVGDRVEKGDILCIIEAMKLMNEIEAEVSGSVEQILVDDATPVEYDQALFIIDED